MKHPHRSRILSFAAIAALALAATLVCTHGAEPSQADLLSALTVVLPA